MRGDVAAIACGDDGVGVKPDPAMLLARLRDGRDLAGALRDDRRHAGRSRDGSRGGRGSGRGRAVSGVGGREELAPLADVVLDSVAELLVGG